ECKSGWHALSKLLKQIGPYIDEYGYYCRQPARHQVGIIRTNCVDSLDRTNVVQSLIAKKVLLQQLLEAGILQPYDQLEDHRDFDSIYRNVWADNADVCSLQYAGTGALKSDYTRTGQRRLVGVLSDGLNSMIR